MFEKWGNNFLPRVCAERGKFFSFFSSFSVYGAVLAMAERRKMNYSVEREILDEGAVDEMAEKSESKPSLLKKVKKSLRYSLLYLH